MSVSRRVAVLAAGLLSVALPASAAPSWNGAYDDLPGGSYQRSCRDITAFNGQVYARCQNNAGYFYDTQVNVRACPARRLENIDGRLQCEAGGGGGSYPGGGGGGWNGGGRGPAGLIVFENPDFKGMRLEISDSVPDLAESGLDDQITSVRVLRGSWLLCSARDFRGDCQTVSADSPNLKTINLNDRITSIRRLGR